MRLHGPTHGRTVLWLATALLLTACGEQSRLQSQADVGPRPQLPEPVKTVLPTVNIAPAKRWAAGQQPQPAAGLAVTALASGLDHPRWLHVLPNGDVLVAESNKPAKPQDSGFSLRGWVMEKVMARAGAGVPSANRITLLRDADGDGQAELRSVLLQGLHSPFGMALVGNTLFVANTDAVMAYAFTSGQTQISDPGRRVTDLPALPINHHWTKALIASPDGRHLYATVGSNSNVGENGLPAEEGRAAIWQIDVVSGGKRLYASGLRNPNGMAWMTGPSGTPVLWTVVNERDEIGSDLVPDYLTSVQDGGFYGWPWSWYGAHVDSRVQPPQPARVASAVVPDYALGAHVAPLGLSSALGSRLPPFAASGVFVGLHGSWNRRPLSGYKVVYVPFAGGQPQGLPVDVLTGFLDEEGRARGRPVGVAIDSRGALLVADDVGNTVWRVSAP
ncbi:MAG: sorbosone dehydrogenase family protein [Rubrivivax sp.]|nr:sorbosone dehydrogenase family protein [Rubrivivax sp.]